MDSVANLQSPEQDMQLPKGQDAILDLLGWQSGPLPDQGLEQIALKLFARQYPMAAWGESGFTAERNECRRFALHLRIDYLKLDRWNASNAAEKLADLTAQIVFGDRRLGKTLRAEVEAFAESYVSDLWLVFRNRLFLPKDVEANNAEVAQEDQQ